MLDKIAKIQEAIRNLDLSDERDRRKFNDAVAVMGRANLSLTNFLTLVDPKVGMSDSMRGAFDVIQREQEEKDQEILDILES